MADAEVRVKLAADLIMLGAEGDGRGGWAGGGWGEERVGAKRTGVPWVRKAMG